MGKYLAALKQKNNTEMDYHQSVISVKSQWDEPRALAMLQDTMDRIKQHYPDGALPWAAEHSPECYRTLKQAEARIAAMFQAQDMAGCRNAIAEYEQSFNRLIEKYSRQRVLSTDEVIAVFDCSRVWELKQNIKDDVS